MQMVHHFLLIFSLLLSATSTAQIGYFSLGYGGNVTNMEGLNKVVANFNDTRPWLQNEMNSFGYLDGFRISIGGATNHAWTDVEWAFRSQKHSASGTDFDGYFNTQELKARNGSYVLSLGYLATKNRFHFATGLRMELGGMIVRTRNYGESNSKGKFERIGFVGITCNLGPVVKLFRIVTDEGALITGSVYYVWAALPQNVTLVDVELNNSVFFTESPEFRFNPHTFGFNLSLGWCSQK